MQSMPPPDTGEVKHPICDRGRFPWCTGSRQRARKPVASVPPQGGARESCDALAGSNDSGRCSGPRRCRRCTSASVHQASVRMANHASSGGDPAGDNSIDPESVLSSDEHLQHARTTLQPVNFQKQEFIKMLKDEDDQVGESSGARCCLIHGYVLVSLEGIVMGRSHTLVSSSPLFVQQWSENIW